MRKWQIAKCKRTAKMVASILEIGDLIQITRKECDGTATFFILRLGSLVRMFKIVLSSESENDVVKLIAEISGLSVVEIVDHIWQLTP